MPTPRTSRDDVVRRAAAAALAVLALTSVHHAYGAYVYRSPWRYHVLPVAAIAAALTVACAAALRGGSGSSSRLARWMFVLVVAVVPVLLIGAFEGGYNHVAKNVLYFGGAPEGLMARLFPSPRYEMPSDAFFEITGVLQAILAALVCRPLLAVARGARARSGDAPAR
jgi:hypothetical protein